MKTIRAGFRNEIRSVLERDQIIKVTEDADMLKVLRRIPFNIDHFNMITSRWIAYPESAMQGMKL